MNSRLTLIALAPALALAACGGGNDDAAEAENPTMAEDNAVEGIDMSTLPQVPMNARETVMWQGVYTNNSAAGGTATLQLDEDMGYTYTDAQGATREGEFNWYSDGQRILITEDGGNQVYAVADGVLYTLANKDAPVAVPTDQAAVWRKADAAITVDPS